MTNATEQGAIMNARINGAPQLQFIEHWPLQGPRGIVFQGQRLATIVPAQHNARATSRPCYSWHVIDNTGADIGSAPSYHCAYGIALRHALAARRAILDQPQGDTTP